MSTSINRAIQQSIRAPSAGRAVLRRVVPSLLRDLHFIGLRELDWRTRGSVTSKKYLHRARKHLGLGLGKGATVAGGEFRVGDAPDAGHLQYVLLDVHRMLRWLELPQGRQPFVVDVGAHNGETAVAFKLLWPSVRVLCFEANPQNFIRASANTGRFGVEVRQVGLSDHSGIEMIAIPSDWEAKSTLVSEAASIPGHTAEVAVARGDDVIPSDTIDVLKVDVEGYEGHVLRGLQSTLPRVEWVLIECSLDRQKDASFGEVVALLDRAGFELLRVGDVGLEEDRLRQSTVDLYFRRVARRTAEIADICDRRSA